jgi:hypothetical protein
MGFHNILCYSWIALDSADELALGREPGYTKKARRQEFFKEGDSG